MSDVDKSLTMELIEEHAFSRKTTGNLGKANNSCANGNREAWQDVRKLLDDLCQLYRLHIEKDKQLFPASNKYFSEQESKAMLKENQQFGQKPIHEVYAQNLRELEEMLPQKE